MTLKASGTLRKALQRSIELSDVLRGQMEAQQSSKEGLDGVVAGLDRENHALREQLGLALVQVEGRGGQVPEGQQCDAILQFFSLVQCELLAADDGAESAHAILALLQVEELTDTVTSQQQQQGRVRDASAANAGGSPSWHHTSSWPAAAASSGSAPGSPSSTATGGRAATTGTAFPPPAAAAREASMGLLSDLWSPDATMSSPTLGSPVALEQVHGAVLDLALPDLMLDLAM